MMRRTFVGAAAVAVLLLLATSKPVSAQGLSSLAAAMSAANGTALEKKAGCWGCGTLNGFRLCEGGYNPGFFNCQTTFGVCNTTSPGCGTPPGMVMLDPDGATQFVSRGSHLGVLVAVLASEPDVRRNCTGLIVARSQSADDIMDIRARTGTLSL